jgi:hypothetical protein
MKSKDREWFLICDSPNAQTSKWVQEEVAMIRAMEGKVFRTVDLSKELETELETELHKLDWHPWEG